MASAWIGNSIAVAVKHYLQVTEDHFKQAAQNAAQKSSEMSGNEWKEETESKNDSVTSSGICRNLQENSASFMSSNENNSGRCRTRTMSKFPEKYANSESGGAKCGARDVASIVSNPELAQLVDVWTFLPTTIRRGIMAMVQEIRRE